MQFTSDFGVFAEVKKTTGELFNSPLNPVEPNIVCEDFRRWVKTYDGPKFNLLHWDFMGETPGTQWELLNTLFTNKDKILSSEAHALFWFDMEEYTSLMKSLRLNGFSVFSYPLIWQQTASLSPLSKPNQSYPKLGYHTCFLATLGHKPIKHSVSNIYSAPKVSLKYTLCENQKPEAMLRYFFRMLVDDYTSLLDPGSGSGAALRAADSLGAHKTFGLELDKDLVIKSLDLTLLVHKNRNLTKRIF